MDGVLKMARRIGIKKIDDQGRRVLASGWIYANVYIINDCTLSSVTEISMPSAGFPVKGDQYFFNNDIYFVYCTIDNSIILTQCFEEDGKYDLLIESV